MLITENLLQIRTISNHCLENKLFVSGYIGERCFKGQYKIYKIALFPFIAWAMTHDYLPNEIRYSYFTHFDYRKQGIAAIMQRALLGDIFKGSYYEDEIL